MRSTRIIDARIIEKFGDDIVSDTAYPEIVYKCIYCEERKGSPDTKGHLYVHNTSLVYFCQRCNASGKVTDSVKGYHFEVVPTNNEFTELLEAIVVKTKKNKVEVVNYDYEVPNLRPVYGTDIYNYLINRGISYEMMNFYDIRIGSVVGKYKDYIIIPNRVTIDEQGRSFTDMFVARYTKQIPKDNLGNDLIKRYLNPFGDNRRKVVFNLHRIPHKVPIIITEGSITAMSAGSNAVATYGKYVTDIQLTQILNHQPSSIYVNLDPDAYDNAIELCERIKKRTDTPLYFVNLPDGTDANDLGHQAYMKYVLNARLYNKAELNVFDILSKISDKY